MEKRKIKFEIDCLEGMEKKYTFKYILAVINDNFKDLGVVPQRGDFIVPDDGRFKSIDVFRVWGLEWHYHKCIIFIGTALDDKP